jgi:hypothetical protein
MQAVQVPRKLDHEKGLRCEFIALASRKPVEEERAF